MLVPAEFRASTAPPRISQAVEGARHDHVASLGQCRSFFASILAQVVLRILNHKYASILGRGRTV